MNNKTVGVYCLTNDTHVQTLTGPTDASKPCTEYVNALWGEV